MKRTIKIITLILAGIIVSVSMFVAAINIHMVQYSQRYIYKNIEELKGGTGKTLQAAVVLGARVYDDGTPCPMLKDRLDAGISAIEAGVVSRLLLTGDHGTRGYDEVNGMKDYTFGKGMEADNVFLDHAGFSTYDSMMRAGSVFEVKSAVVATQEFHLSRAIYIARKNGIETYGISADLRQYPRSEMFRYTAREWLARTKDFLLVNIFKPDPVFLGDKIPITGDSSLSYD